MIFSDRNLSQKIERAEGQSNAAFVEARARMFPDSGACWIEAGGALAMFDGVNSPCTQTFGLGVFEEATDAILDELEAFFKERGAPVMHEVSPLAGVSVAQLLAGRGYRPIEQSSIMYLSLEKENRADLRLNPRIETRIIEAGEENLWARLSAEGWLGEAGMEEFRDFMFEFGRISAQLRGGVRFLAELDRQPISTGMLFVHEDAAVLAGASTILAGRQNGAQTALLAARLRCAAETNCRIAIMAALPGSQSQRNAEKNNFRIAYTRTKWMLESER
jgi:hypothetical protein